MADQDAPRPGDVIAHRDPRLIFSETRGKTRAGRHGGKRCEAVARLLCFMAENSLAWRRVPFDSKSPLSRLLPGRQAAICTEERFRNRLRRLFGFLQG